MSDKEDIMPQPLVNGKSSSTTLGFVINTYEAWKVNDFMFKNAQNRPSILGFPLPEWQRPFVWTDEQCVKLIENIWKGNSIGTFMINVLPAIEDNPLDGIIIDGQQRMTALQKYLDNEFSTKDANGNDIFWKDVPPISKRRFKSMTFPHIEVNLTDENKLIEVYNTLNFSGTAHTELDRAKSIKPR